MKDQTAAGSGTDEGGTDPERAMLVARSVWVLLEGSEPSMKVSCQILGAQGLALLPVCGIHAPFESHPNWKSSDLDSVAPID